MIFDNTTRNWIDNAMKQIHEGQVSQIQAARVLRTVSQLYERAAADIELQLVDKVENRLYNTHLNTKGASNESQ